MLKMQFSENICVGIYYGIAYSILPTYYIDQTWVTSNISWIHIPFGIRGYNLYMIVKVYFNQKLDQCLTEGYWVLKWNGNKQMKKERMMDFSS